MKRLFIVSLILAAALAFGVGLAQPSLAADPGQESLQLLEKTGLGGTSPGEAGSRLPVIVGNIIRALLGFLGIILVVLMIYSGFLWMTARGNTEQVEKAKQTISRAVIGAIIIFAAYAITDFVVRSLVTAATK